VPTFFPFVTSPWSNIKMSLYSSLRDHDEPGHVPPPQQHQSLKRQQILKYLYVPFLVVVWYAMNIIYSVWHKRAVALLNLPITLAAIQLACGPIVLIPFWLAGVRQRPWVARHDLRILFPIGLFHMINHVTSSISLATGAVSFSHTVKAAEPAFTCIAAAIFLKSYFPWQVYFSLIPIMGGVAVSSCHESGFSVISLICALASNVARAARAIASKVYMDHSESHTKSTHHDPDIPLSPANLYAIMTCIAFLCAFPLALLLEASKFRAEYELAVQRGMSVSFLCECVIVSGLMSYQDVSFLLLAEMHPVSHAVGNVFKGVAVIFVSVLVFGNRVTLVSGIGCAVTVLGTFAFVFAKFRYSPAVSLMGQKSSDVCSQLEK